jgi:hypothetical protein
LLSGLFLIAAAAAYYLKKRDANWKLLMLLPFFILSIYFLFCNSNYRIGSLQSGNLIKNKIELLNSSGKKTILCAEDFADDHIIYNGFNEYPNLSFYPFSKYDSLTRIANSVNRGSDLLVIVNIEKTKVPDFISNNLSNWQEFYAKDHLLIYQAKGLKNILPN